MCQILLCNFAYLSCLVLPILSVSSGLLSPTLVTASLGPWTPEHSQMSTGTVFSVICYPE